MLVYVYLSSFMLIDSNLCSRGLIPGPDCPRGRQEVAYGNSTAQEEGLCHPVNSRRYIGHRMRQMVFLTQKWTKLRTDICKDELMKKAMEDELIRKWFKK